MHISFHQRVWHQAINGPAQRSASSAPVVDLGQPLELYVFQLDRENHEINDMT
jgi:hypothetical protein